MFVSPFDLEAEITYSEEDGEPLWLEKVRAKRNIYVYLRSILITHIYSKLST